MNHTTIPFLQSARFPSKEASEAPYAAMQQILRDLTDIDLSIYRILQSWEEEPPRNKGWFVIVLGDIPPAPATKQILKALARGEIAPIPNQILEQLGERHRNNRENLQDTGIEYYEIHNDIAEKEVNHVENKNKRAIKVTVYLTIQLYNTSDKSFLKEVYTELSFPVVIEHADPTKEARDIVPDSLVHSALDAILHPQLLLPDLKKKYPHLPDFYIGDVKLATQQAFFEDIPFPEKA